MGLFVLISALNSRAQQITGSIVGTVKDEQGAVVPGAAVKATNVDTGFSRLAYGISTTTRGRTPSLNRSRIIGLYRPSPSSTAARRSTSSLAPTRTLTAPTTTARTWSLGRTRSSIHTEAALLLPPSGSIPRRSRPTAPASALAPTARTAPRRATIFVRRVTGMSTWGSSVTSALNGSRCSYAVRPPMPSTW